MANVLLTTRCIRSCPYCFAAKEITGNAPDLRMGWENLIFIANFLEASNHKRVSLLGGEPAMHPNFVDFILYFIERQFRVTVFTSAVMSERRLGEVAEHLTKTDREQLGFVVNVNNPDQTPAPDSEEKRIEAFLEVMGPWSAPGFNIYREDFDLNFLEPLVARHGMRRHLRLGITHPIPGEDGSQYIPADRIGKVMDRLFEHRQMLARARLKPGFDCGFPLCQVTDEQLGWLYRHTGDASFHCGPAVDIDPNLDLYACFPLSNYHRRSLLEFDSFREVVEFYRKAHDTIRQEVPGIYEDCEHCQHREDRRCDGGGTCHTVNLMVDEAPVRLPEIEDALPRAGLSV